jgi:hypothetical protein
VREPDFESGASAIPPLRLDAIFTTTVRRDNRKMTGEDSSVPRDSASVGEDHPGNKNADFARIREICVSNYPSFQFRLLLFKKIRRM